jgi:alpha-L-fucosidase
MANQQQQSPAVFVDKTIVDPTSLDSGGNLPERSEWFRDLALGMFIHWNVDSPLGGEISHPMIGAEERILHQYEQDLPRLFSPSRFDADEYALLAETVGMRYFMFTAKHHAGFCMYDSAVTPYNVMRTPYAQDLVAQFVEAFRRRKLGVGLYFSPLDFYWLWKNGRKLQFLNDEVVPAANPGLMDYNKRQLAELLTNYGDIDLLFFDGPPEGLKEHAWQLNPRVLVTRGEMQTPEQKLPDAVIDDPWETCHTIGDQWNWKATNVVNRTGSELIRLLIETRAKGGNLLLNVTPDPHGQIPVEQDAVLRELGLWVFWNRPAVYQVRPWHTLRDGDIWFAREKNSDTVFAYVLDGQPWHRGKRREFLLQGVRATAQSTIELVGQNGEVMEHSHGETDIKTHWQQTESGLFISAMRCYRPYGNMRWHNPVVIRITHAEKG